MHPNFIGIGAPKAGTTWLFTCLSEHPEVFVAPCKETNFFDYATIEGRMEEYHAHFVGSTGFAAVGEISTRYLTSTRAPERIKKIIPSARLFVSLRNPIEQVYSHYWHLTRQNFHQWKTSKLPRNIEEAIEQYGDKLLGSAYYFNNLQRWLQYFDRSQLLVILFDDITSRPQEVLTKLYGFLGVDDTFKPPSIHRRDSSVRRGTSPRSPALGRIHSSLYDQMNRNVYHPLKQLIGLQAAIRMKDALKVRPIMERLFQQSGYPEMDPRARALLQGCFAQDIQKLADLTGLDFSQWK